MTGGVRFIRRQGGHPGRKKPSLSFATKQLKEDNHEEDGIVKLCDSSLTRALYIFIFYSPQG